MMNKVQMTLLAFVAIAAGSASAVRAGEPHGPYGTFNWTGAYAGLQAGYGWSSARYSDDTYLSEANPDGFIGGGYIGYNYQLPSRLVLGIEADIVGSGMDGSDGQRYLSDPSVSIAGVELEMETRWSAAIRGRIGYAYGRYLPYIAGGVSFTDYEFRWIDHVNATVPFKREQSRTGWNIGTGVEYAANDWVIVRAEYRYTDFGTDHFPNDFAGPESKMELQTHDLRLGIGVKF